MKDISTRQSRFGNPKSLREAPEAPQQVPESQEEPSVTQSAQDLVSKVGDEAASAAYSLTGTGDEDPAAFKRRATAPSPCCYIGNLSFEMTSTALSRIFEPFGPIIKCRIIMDVRGLSKGYAMRTSRWLADNQIWVY